MSNLLSIFFFFFLPLSLDPKAIQFMDVSEIRWINSESVVSCSPAAMQCLMRRRYK